MVKENVIIIGAGIGGLSCGALLAQAGHKVTILEKNSYIGGACSSYEKEGYTFDRAVHLFTSGLNGPYGEVLRRCGMEDALKMRTEINAITAMKIYQTEGYFPFDFNINSMFKMMKPATPGKKPEGSGSGSSSGKGENPLMKGLGKMGVDRDALKALTRVMTNILTMSKRKIKALYTEGLTVTDYINQWSEHSFVHGIFAFLLAGMFAISPKKASAGEFVHCFKSEMTAKDGYQYPIGGGAQAIPNAFAECLKKFGGVIKTNTPVKSIIVKGDKVQGVMVGDELIEAPIVITNLTIRMSITGLIGRDYFEKSYIHKIENLEPSLSSMTFKLALKEPIVKEWGFVNCYHPSLYDLADKYPPDQGYPYSNGFFGPILSNIDASLAPPGGQTIIFGTITPSKGPDWTKWKDAYWEDLQSFYPNLESKLAFMDISFPKDLTAATGKPAGPVEGLSLSPEQTGENKPSSVIPGIEGLFIVGDTAGKSAHGIGTQLACESGIHVADVIIGTRDISTI